MRKFVVTLSILAMLLLVQAAMANTLVSTIDGNYGITYYDTPTLLISNSTLANLGTAYDFTNVTLTLTGYQGGHNGQVQVFNMANIASSTTQTDIWGVTFGGSGMAAYDYDDTGPYTSCDANYDPGLPANLCGNPGNFYVTFQATLTGVGAYNGMSIFSQFSPHNNASGTFVGWEGLDPFGWSETTYDSHGQSGPNGVLANIYIGTPPPIGTPEPSSLLLLGTGLIGIGSRAWKRFRG